MKKMMLVAALSLSFSGVVFAADSHTNWQGATDKFTGVITSKDKFEDLIKYASTNDPVHGNVRQNLRDAFADGKLTAEEIKASGISDHHFYTGLLASSQTQAEYDKNLKMLNGGANMDDKFVSNRDLKAHGSMIINQVDTKMQIAAGQQAQVDNKQDQRLDKIVAGLQDLGNHIQAQVPTLPPVENNNPEPQPGYDDSAIKEQVNTNTGNIQNNANNIASMGAAFEQRVDAVNGYLSQAGAAISSNTGRIDTLENNFNALANQTAAEIARMDGRIDELEKKTDRLKAGVAGANAIGSLTQYTGNGTHHVAVGLGGYDGASALAGGYTYAISAQTTVRVTVAYDSEGDFGYGASVGHSW